ncbi:tyrosine-sulfated glycopeptide receptor 1-like [Miscanthus floridulus]|uniref:tyrosine-sulfated glycopeptide receptor 1-like n=1 Tax=Miscanthus floridulus TaxID=154761 RepID=UPI00345ABCE2
MGFSSLALGMLLLLSLSSVSSHATPCPDQDKRSLLRFIAELSVDSGLAMSSWWNDTADCCLWKGITCNGDGVVTEVSLPGRGLQGRISPALGELTGLLHINLSWNALSGGLPLEQLMSSGSIVTIDVSFSYLKGELGELSSSVTHGRPLQVLNISSNQFTGEFPSRTWKLLKNLVTLNVSNNSFSGQVPSSFCLASASITVLELQCNQFSGKIPLVLGNCSNLKVLKAGHNNLGGTIPDELFNATSLEHLSLRNAGLQGTLDGSPIGKLSDLVTLDLGENNFTGTIPDSIGLLKTLEQLHLDYNMMSGELPSTLCNCTNLVTIILKNNYFSGELTKVNFSTLINLEMLDLLYNNFSGTIPGSIYSCSNMVALRLSYNNFHGQLSPRIGNLESLIFLSIGSNNFTNITNTLHVLRDCKNLTFLYLETNFKGEAMPQDETVDGFQNLQVFTLHMCSLSGKFPHWISRLKNLKVLLLHNNQLNGPIPAWIKSLESLLYLDISNNRFAGEIPSALMELPMLTTGRAPTQLDPMVFELPVSLGQSLQVRETSGIPKVLNLGHNNFTGVIPQEIGQLKSLTTLNISFNMLSGEIPQQLCNLSNLQVLDLSSNHFTGALPSDLNTLHFLSAFNVSNNDLKGPIPTGGQFSTFPNSSFEGNPELCGVMVNQLCGRAEAPPGFSTLSKEQSDRRVAFVIAFGPFFVVGVLYDQLVLAKYFG